MKKLFSSILMNFWKRNETKVLWFFSVGEWGPPEGWRDQKNWRVRCSGLETRRRPESDKKYRVCKTCHRKVWSTEKKLRLLSFIEIFDLQINHWQQGHGFIVRIFNFFVFNFLLINITVFTHRSCFSIFSLKSSIISALSINFNWKFSSLFIFSLVELFLCLIISRFLILVTFFFNLKRIEVKFYFFFFT